ncbi:PAS domain S-box protein [Breoghania sp. L-A4]|nr:PAS domain S-box protein [Breoghania sp. L-A4]
MGGCMNSAHYISLFDAFPDPIVLTEISGRIVSANRAFERISGYGHGELIGENVAQLLSAEEPSLPEEAASAESAASSAVTRIHSARNQHHVFRHKTGRPFVAEASSQPIEIAGQWTGRNASIRFCARPRRRRVSRGCSKGFSIRRTTPILVLINGAPSSSISSATIWGSSTGLFMISATGPNLSC